MLLPGKTIGILGGGELGRMLAQAAQRIGYRVHVFEPAADSPAGEIASREFSAPYAQTEALTAFVKTCDVVTFEADQIPVEPLWAIEKIGVMHPHWNVLEVCQNRMREKTWLRKNGFPHVPFTEVEAGDDLQAGIRRMGLPCVVKTADFVHEARPPLKVSDAAGADHAVNAFARQRVVVEKYIDFKCELSVIVARTAAGETRTFPVSESIHTKHVLDFSIAPARVNEAIRVEAENLAKAIAAKLNVVGLLTVELFLTDRGEILVNELAPRPHDSGHYTLDACVTSQFEQQVRAVCGLPLGDVSQTSPCVTVNILGDAWKWHDGRVATAPHWAALFEAPRVKLHLYGKPEPRPGRKMGHFSVCADEVNRALDTARELKAKLTGRG